MKMHFKIQSDKLRTFYAGPKVIPDSKVPGANMGLTWILSDPDGPHAGPMNPCYQGCQVPEPTWAKNADDN